MSRRCELCGGAEAGEEEETQTEASDAIELLYVCDRCRKERQPSEEL